MRSSPAEGPCFYSLVCMVTPGKDSCVAAFVSTQQFLRLGVVDVRIWRCRLSRTEKMETHVLGSRFQNFFFSEEVERWRVVGHAHNVRNQCTADEFWGTSSARQVLVVATFFPKRLIFASAHVRSLVSEGRTVHASHWVQYFVSVCLVLRCAWHLGVSGFV